MLKTIALLLMLACVTGEPATASEPTEPSNTTIDMAELTTLLTQYRDSHDGQLPESFRVRIDLHGYAKAGRPFDSYEFSPTEVVRFQPQVKLNEKNGNEELVYDNVKHVLMCDTVQRENFTHIDDVCRILLALDYPDLVKSMAGTNKVPNQNLHYLSVMTGAGLPAMGDCRISISFDGKSCECHECCVFRNGFTSAQSIRFAALFHVLRQLARSNLGLAQRQWQDAIRNESPLSLAPAKTK